MIKAVAFDLDNTLIDFSTFKEKTSRAAADAMLEHGLRAKPDELYRKIWAVYEAKGIEYQKTFSDVLSEYELEPNDFERIQQAAISAYLKTKFDVLRPYPQVRKTLETLKRRGMILGIITDAPRNKAWQRLVITGLWDLFDVVVTHDDTKEFKPSASPFKLFLKKTRLKPEEVLFVGDNPERDVKGAKAAGMKTALAGYGWHLNKDSREKADFHLKSFRELLALNKQPLDIVK